MDTGRGERRIPPTPNDVNNNVKSLVKILAVVAVGVTAMILIVLTGLFHSVYTEIGLEHYAEGLTYSARSAVGLRAFLPMPANTIVNLGYIIVGAVWIRFIYQQTVISPSDRNMFYVFNSMSVYYGFIQAARILFQTHSLAVLDQWVTLPFFAWVINWSQQNKPPANWPVWKMVMVMMISLSSYGLCLLSTYGFEAALALNILVVVLAAYGVLVVNQSSNIYKSFALAILSCVGFVVLKVLDLQLMNITDLFFYISGHFLSKIADILQIHYVNQFFFYVVLEKMKRKKGLCRLHKKYE